MWKLSKSAIPSSLATRVNGHVNPKLMRSIRIWQWRWMNSKENVLEKTGRMLDKTHVQLKASFQRKNPCDLQGMILKPLDFARQNSRIFEMKVSGFAMAKTGFFSKTLKTQARFSPRRVVLHPPLLLSSYAALTCIKARVVSQHHAEMELHENRRTRHSFPHNPVGKVVQSMTKRHLLKLLLPQSSLLLRKIPSLKKNQRTEKEVQIFPKGCFPNNPLTRRRVVYSFGSCPKETIPKLQSRTFSTPTVLPLLGQIKIIGIPINCHGCLAAFVDRNL